MFKSQFMYSNGDAIEASAYLNAILRNNCPISENTPAPDK